jgi:PKD repeat protein
VTFRNNTPKLYDKDSQLTTVQYTWSFDDSLIKSNDQEVTYIWTTPGTHTAALRMQYGNQAFTSDTAVITVSDSCRASADFTAEPNSGEHSATFYNGTTGDLDCIESYNIFYGDSLIETLPKNWKSVKHVYNKRGVYSVVLIAKGKSNRSFSVTKTVAVDSALAVQLTTIEPRKVSPKTITANTTGYWVLIGLASVLLTAIITGLMIWMRREQDRKEVNEARRKFTPGKRKAAGWSYEFPVNTTAVSFEGSPDVIVSRQSGMQKDSYGVVDVNTTIYETIRKAGFPQLHYYTALAKKEYIFLVDLGTGNNQQSDLFELLIENGIEKGTQYKIYYYRTDPFLLSDNRSMSQPVKLADLARLYRESNLIIFGDGYGFVNPGASGDQPDDLFKNAVLLEKWSRKALITPVPRNNWSRDERLLYMMIPVFPATTRGLELVKDAMNLPRHKLSAPSREGAESYMFFPVQNQVGEYEKFFQEDTRLLIWLYALALADKPGWAVTIAVGEALQENYFRKNDAPLVTYANLLKITSIEWMQTGQLSIAHRQEMMNQLRKEPDCHTIFETAARALLELSRKVKVEKGTITETQKAVKEEIWEQYIKDDPLTSIAYLNRENYIDSFHAKELQIEKKIKTLRGPRSELNAAGGTIFVLLIVFTLLLNNWTASSGLARNFFPPVIKFDSFAYYNNLACDAMDPVGLKMNYYFVDDSSALQHSPNQQQAGPDPNKQLITPEALSNRVNALLDKAEKFKETDSANILSLNRRILTYVMGQFYFDNADDPRYAENYSRAIDSFTSVQGKDSIGLNAYYGKAMSLWQINQTDSACVILNMLRTARFTDQPLTLPCVSTPQQQTGGPQMQTGSPGVIPGRAALRNAVAELNAGSRAYTVNGNRYMGAFVRKYNSFAGRKEGEPWAATFVSWCFNKDSSYFKNFASVSDFELNFKTSGFTRRDARPIPGDIYFYNWRNANGSPYRAIGIVESYDPQNGLTGIEGNSNRKGGVNFEVARVIFSTNEMDSLNFVFARVDGRRWSYRAGELEPSFQVFAPDSAGAGFITVLQVIFIRNRPEIASYLALPDATVRLDAPGFKGVLQNPLTQSLDTESAIWQWNLVAPADTGRKIIKLSVSYRVGTRTYAASLGEYVVEVYDTKIKKERFFSNRVIIASVSILVALGAALSYFIIWRRRRQVKKKLTA